MIKTYNKLVRDKTVEEIEADGRKANYRLLDENELLEALGNKIVEEAEEVREALKNGKLSEINEELADVIEVIEAIINNITDTESVVIRKIYKKTMRGKYKKRVFLESVEE